MGREQYIDCDFGVNKDESGWIENIFTRHHVL